MSQRTWSAVVTGGVMALVLVVALLTAPAAFARGMGGGYMSGWGSDHGSHMGWSQDGQSSRQSRGNDYMPCDSQYGQADYSHMGYYDNSSDRWQHSQRRQNHQ